MLSLYAQLNKFSISDRSIKCLRLEGRIVVECSALERILALVGGSSSIASNSFSIRTVRISLSSDGSVVDNRGIVKIRFNMSRSDWATAFAY